jgi:hypothetical protein
MMIGFLEVVLAVCAPVVGAAVEVPVSAPTDDLVRQAAVRLPDGDWIVYEWHMAGNAPVKVQRVGPGMTGVKWTATLKEGVVRQRISRGLQRGVYVDPGRGENEGTVEFVVSAETAGFRETLDLATGKSLKREEAKH